MASRSWNRVELIGNLTRDPELRYTPNGAAVCTFGMATNRTYVSEGERKEEADFHRLVAWNKLAELCNQLLKKGNRVFISGRLQTRSWEGQDGQTRNVTEIVIEDMILLTPKVNGEQVSVPEDLDIEPVKTVEEPKQKAEKEEVEEEPKTEGQKEESKEKTKKSEAEITPQEEIKDDLPF
ncbi:hypothetical protein A2964_02530 [Candidatus Daviesbacteria bacterium RIFCSPLOWO2_01_FULL_40_27]|nr:MAG: hypothetical protein A2964_02530 [Candidatus Daviesbacteria bacterium RIFCSPLOWO2_01_FULL_40_27]